MVSDVTGKDPHLVELGQFLRARRAGLTPDAIGLPARDAAARRVAGLRREEVADQVAISHDYYTRIEQGRLAPSEPVLAAIVGLLRLTPDESSYVEGLAARAGRRTPLRRRATVVRPQLQRMLDQLTDTPAFVVGKYLDYLASNKLAAALLNDVDKLPAKERNYIRLLFTDPRTKDYYPDWEAMARGGVALLRMQAVDNPTDPRLVALVGEMSLVSPQFRQWWADRHVASPVIGTKTIIHPQLGALTFDWDAFVLAGDPDQQLIMWSAEPGSATHDKFRILSSLIATTPATAVTKTRAGT